MMAALKEWAVVCKALSEGRQVLLLRKGGIMEYRQGFELRHDKFLLYPTFEHQASNSIQADYEHNLNSKQKYPTDTATISSYAHVTFIQEVNNSNILPKLKKYHIWSDSYVDMRMNYNPKKPMNVILLRVYNLDSPFEISVKKEWAGCKSWIPLDFSNESGTSALDDEKFNQIESEVKGVLYKQ